MSDGCQIMHHMRVLLFWAVVDTGDWDWEERAKKGGSNFDAGQRLCNAPLQPYGQLAVTDHLVAETALLTGA